MVIALLGSLVVGSGVEAASSSVPTGLSVTAADSRVTVSFTEPDLTPAGVSPSQSDTRLGYVVNVYQEGQKLGATELCLNGVSTTESCVVTNYVRIGGGSGTLENGVTYTFRVIARWSDGDAEIQSLESVASIQATPFTNPDKPATPTGTINDTTSTSVDVSWVAPSDNGESIDLYSVTVWNKLGTSQITSNTGCTASTLTCTVTGLTLGSAYTFKVKANNSAGDSINSDVSNAVTLVPGLATSLASVTTTASDGTTSVQITWAQPVVNDETITEFTVTATAGTTTVDKTTTGAMEATFTADISGGDLVLGTEYLVNVKAKNAGGYGSYTSTTAITPSKAPGAPTSVAATFSGRTAAVTWAAPASNGGDAITEYTATAFASAATDTSGTALGSCTSTGALTCSIPDLTAGTGYKFAVKAKNNANGYGEYSSLSSTATAPTAQVTTIADVNNATATTVPSRKLSVASGMQVVVSRAPAASIIKEIEVAVSAQKVSMYISTPASRNTKTAIVKYLIELRPVKGTSIKKTVVVKSAQVIRPYLTGKRKTTYTVVIVAYQKSGRAITWKGPKVVTK